MNIYIDLGSKSKKRDDNYNNHENDQYPLKGGDSPLFDGMYINYTLTDNGALPYPCSFQYTYVGKCL